MFAAGKCLLQALLHRDSIPRAEGCAQRPFSTRRRAATIIIRCSGYNLRIFCREKVMADRSPGAVRGRS